MTGLSIAFVAIFLPHVFGGCCLPNYVTGNMTEGVKLSDTFLWDFTRNKIVTMPLSGYTLGPNLNTYSLIDFKADKVYYYFNPGGCTEYSGTSTFLGASFPQCIPDSAKKVREESGNEEVGGDFDFDTWEFDVEDYHNVNHIIRLKLRKDTCLPVAADMSYIGIKEIDFKFDENFPSEDSLDPADLDKLKRDNSDCYNGDSVFPGK